MGVFVSIRHGRPRPPGVPVFGEHRDYFSGQNESWAELGLWLHFPLKRGWVLWVHLHGKHLTGGSVALLGARWLIWGLDGSFRGSMAPADY